MGQITGGRVVYGRTVQPAQYESKRADVELTFVVAEGEDYGSWLAKVVTETVTKVHEIVGIKQTVTVGSPQVVLTEEKKPRGRPAKAVAPVEELGAVATTEVMEKEITDEELNDAVTKCVNHTKNAAAIRQLRNQYVTPGGGVRDIPNEKRAAFIAELANIKAIAADLEL